MKLLQILLLALMLAACQVSAARDILDILLATRTRATTTHFTSSTSRTALYTSTLTPPSNDSNSDPEIAENKASPYWKAILVYGWTFPDYSPKWVVTNESLSAANPCPPLLPSVERPRRGADVGVFTHESGRGIGFMLEGTEQHAIFHQNRRWTLARENGTVVGNCTRSADLVPERCEDDFMDYSALLLFECVLITELAWAQPNNQSLMAWK